MSNQGVTLEITLDLVGNTGNELLDVQLGRTGLLAGRVGTLEAAGGLLQGTALAQGRVLDVIEVVLQRAVSLRREAWKE